MSDYNSSLPVRTQADVDERLQSKIVDFTNPALGMEVDADGNAQAKMHGSDPASADRVIRVSELGAVSVDGVYHATNNTLPSASGMIAHTRDAAPDETDQTKRITAISNGTVHAMDVSLHDSAGAAINAGNPLPVSFSETLGDEVHAYNTSAAVAANASVQHEYTVTALKTLNLKQILAAASGKMKAEVKVETGVAAGTYNTKAVRFNSTANPLADTLLSVPLVVLAGVKVRITLTNLDNQAQDLYSTIIGTEF